MKFLCIFLLFFCTSAIAEIPDMPEGTTLDDPNCAFGCADNANNPISPVIITRNIPTKKDCKITCPDKYDLHIEYEGKDAVIRGCGESFRIECGGGDGR